ncbi:hypothetical protein N825_21275 [Skermanella stibiiresistens SB22]|uniref:Uncharacterized protein n=1 Tax=Skermanella stibiiresistens SB22 TaxID=1385369 RepID=W9GXG7_9PROT|nr:hypothetical protein [Skermanella stibiiresistens]EWY37122.1 hypothetical protein N825_21275 [Skermanella stibiiresistens SB22]
MRIIYSYEGERDEGLEGSVLKDIGERFGQVGATGSHSGEDGLTTVTLDLGAGQHWREVVDALERRGDLVEVAGESFGEGA